jgi:uncharacterized protein involved in type VI secretion and phage assembly
MSQELDLRGLLEGRVKSVEEELDGTRKRIYGLTTGIVKSLLDPAFLGRVQVSFPWLDSSVNSAWAPVATAWAGSNRGSYLLPEVDDEVVVGFLHGDLKHPVVVGFVWNDIDRPPEAAPLLERRELKSKSGHQVVFDDLPGLWSLTLESQGGHTVKLDDTAGAMKISISDSSQNLSIELDSVTGKITISSTAGQIALSAPVGRISLDAPNIDIHATGALSLKGDGAVSMTGAVVKIN